MRPVAVPIVPGIGQLGDKLAQGGEKGPVVLARATAAHLLQRAPQPVLHHLQVPLHSPLTKKGFISKAVEQAGIFYYVH